MVKPAFGVEVDTNMSRGFQKEWPGTELQSLLNSVTCEMNNDIYNLTKVINLQAVLTQTHLDVIIYQCKVRVLINASDCGATTNTDPKVSTRTIFPPTVLNLKPRECRDLVKTGLLDTELFPMIPGYPLKQAGRRLHEYNLTSGYSGRFGLFKDEVLDHHSCTLGENGYFYFQKMRFTTEMFSRELEVWIKRHEGSYNTDTSELLVPNLNFFYKKNLRNAFFDNEQGTFILDNAKNVKRSHCYQTIELFKGKALYYENKVLNHKIREVGQGDVIIMNTIDGAVAFVTSGVCNFCQHHEVYQTNFKDVRLIQYDNKPTFNAGKETISSLEQNLAMRRQISRTLNNSSPIKLLEFFQTLKKKAENFMFPNYMQLCQINTTTKINATAISVLSFYFIICYL